jgi:hypothetical protein
MGQVCFGDDIESIVHAADQIAGIDGTVTDLLAFGIGGADDAAAKRSRAG